MAADEIAATIREIQERVRARYPEGTTSFAAAPLADLMPLVHSRDAAEGKVAAIGTVNPRRGGPVNAVIQAVKRLVSRSLDWHVREQVEFNRAVLDCVEAALGALSEHNQGLVTLASRTQAALEEMRRELGEGQRRVDDAVAAVRDETRQETQFLKDSATVLRNEAAELKDVRAHWVEWRREWERKLSVNEVQFLRSVADLQAAFQHRSTLMEGNFRDIAAAQHRDFTGALERSSLEIQKRQSEDLAKIQKRLWEDLANVRAEYDTMIHSELRVIRQRAAASAAAPVAAAAAPAPPPLNFDSLRFADRFRGTPEYVKQNQGFYRPYFENCRSVLDIGCGRGEFLAVAGEAGIAARGIDLDEECVAICRAAGLAAEKADLFEYLPALPHSELDGIFCGQVVEHLPPERLPDFIALAAGTLRRGGVIAIETPNPECLAIFATHFYLDPTHARPVPAPLLVFYLEEAGFGRIEVQRRFPAAESLEGVRGLPREFLDQFFGCLDYAVIARKL